MQAASHRLPLDVIKLEITEPILWIVRISPIAVVKVALERKLYGGCMDSFVGVVIEPCGIDVLHIWIILGLKKAKLWFLKIIEMSFYLWNMYATNFKLGLYATSNARMFIEWLQVPVNWQWI